VPRDSKIVNSDPPAPDSPERDRALLDVAWFLFVAAVSTLWCVSAARAIGPTFDEPNYLQWGLEHWRGAGTKPFMKAGTMPLAADVQTLPLRIWEYWRGAQIDLPRELGRMLPWMRAGTLVFWWAMLCYAWRGGRMLGGAWGGRIAVALVACEPLFLAHAALATSDIAVAACLLAIAVEFSVNRGNNWPQRVALPGALFGLAVLTKASALVLGPLCLLAVDWSCLGDGEVFRRWWRDTWQICVIGVCLTLVYCGSDWNTEPTFIQWAQDLPSGSAREAWLFIAEHLRIFPNGGEGLVKQITHNIRGHNVYVLGEVYRRAVWFYFPLTLSIKTSLPLLLLPLAIAAVKPRALANWACYAAVILLLDSMTWRVQIGARFLLPVLAFGCVGLGAAAAKALLERPHVTRWLAGWVGAGLLCAGFSAWRIWPEGIVYANELWGGSRGSYRWLSDSNFDWGQGLPELRAWAERHGVAPLEVWYFGRDPTVRDSPLREWPLHFEDRIHSQPMEEIVAGKCVAVSVTLLHGAYTSEDPSRTAAAFFRSRIPIDRTLTFLIYDFRTGTAATPASPAASPPQ
jgi:hypothetical protein